MSRNPPDPHGDARHLRVLDFCDDLIRAADSTDGIKWQRFISHAAVERELTRRGYELCEESANHDPRLKRFFAMKTSPRPIQPEYP